MNIKVEIQVEARLRGGLYLYVKLWRGGALLIQTDSAPTTSWLRPEMEKDRGEYLGYWGRYRLIFTPPGWKPVRSYLALKEYDPA